MADCTTAFRQALETFSREVLPPRRLLVGFSGGLDSTVLLRLASLHAPERIQALHVNHGYSELAQQWQQHCQDCCRRWQIPLIIEHVPAAGGQLREAEARDARYRIFTDRLQSGDLLLLAHHADDQAETLLLHMLQGRGVFGMPQSRRLGAGWLLRPLLRNSRASLREYARAQQLDWIDDPSNLDTRHDRNFLRREILPQLSARFAPLPLRLQQLADHNLALTDLLAETLRLDVPALPLSLLQDRPLPQQLAIVRIWLTTHSVPQPSTDALRDLLRQLEQSDPARGELVLPQLSLKTYRDHLHAVVVVEPDYQPVPVTGPAELKLAQGTLVVMRTDAGEEIDKTLVVRFFQPGAAAESATLQPGKILLHGHQQSIRELFRAQGIPPWQRDGFPLICDDQGVLLIPGIASRDGSRSMGLSFAWQPVNDSR